MGVFVQFDDGVSEPVFGADVGTNKAWGDFSRWVDTLPVEKFEQVYQLTEHGWTKPPKDLVAQLRTALDTGKPSATVKKTGEIILAAAKDRMPKQSEAVYICRSE